VTFLLCLGKFFLREKGKIVLGHLRQSLTLLGDHLETYLWIQHWRSVVLVLVSGRSKW
jgi:hypothetical protein